MPWRKLHLLDDLNSHSLACKVPKKNAWHSILNGLTTQIDVMSHFEVSHLWSGLCASHFIVDLNCVQFYFVEMNLLRPGTFLLVRTCRGSSASD